MLPPLEEVPPALPAVPATAPVLPPEPAELPGTPPLPVVPALDPGLSEVVEAPCPQADTTAQTVTQPATAEIVVKRMTTYLRGTPFDVLNNSTQSRIELTIGGARERRTLAEHRWYERSDAGRRRASCGSSTRVLEDPWQGACVQSARERELRVGIGSAALLAVALVAACTQSTTPEGGNQTSGAGASAGAASGSGGVGTSGGAPSAGGASAGLGGSAGIATGGTAGNAGASASGGTAGSGGAGGTGAVVKDCATEATVTSPILADFEAYDGTVGASDFVFLVPGTAATYAGSYFFDDDPTTGAEFGTSTFSILAGHASNWGISLVRSYTAVDLQPGAWGAATGIWFGCIDASSFSGLSFWVRGSVPLGTVSLTLAMEDTNPPAADPAGGGTCAGAADTCKGPSVADIPVTADWTEITLPWAMFTNGTAGTTEVPATGARLTGMQFSAGLEFVADPAFVDDPNDPNDMPTYIAVPAPIDFKIDDVGFTP